MCADNGQTRIDWMDTLAQVLRNRPAFEHIWHAREQTRYPLHPAVREAVLLAAPADWHALVLQWAHKSVNDFTRLAYTRSVDHGAADRQTITTVNKYLTANFPTLPAHTIRDLAAKHTAGGGYHITWDMDQMLIWLARSPKSCMVWDHWRTGDWHPYMAYDPRFGWGFAVRIEDGEVMARALINRNSMTFVRSFGAVNNSRGHSQNDDALNSWLMSQGYDYVNDWSGEKLAIVENPNTNNFSAPYIDGYAQHVDLRSDHLLICDDGEYECCNQDGSYSDANCDFCNDCDDRINLERDDHYYVGRYENHLVCESCCDHNYTRVNGCGGDPYYVSNDCAVHVESSDSWYDERYLSDNDIVYLEDTNDYEHRDKCIYLENRSEWVSADCTYAVYCEDSDTHEHIEDCDFTESGYILKTNNDQSEAA